MTEVPPARDSTVVTSAEIRAVAEDALRGVADGDGMDDRTAALIGLSVRAVVTTMDTEGSEQYIRVALAAGATSAQVQEVLTVVAAIGVHTLFESSRQLARIAAELDSADSTAPATADRELWARYVGDDPYWARVEVEVPGFLDALLRMSPEAFGAFFEFCSVPWKSRTVPALTKELVSLACDATPGHRYLPGFRLHLANALELGAGALVVRDTLCIAEKAPMPRGVR
ncbi:carboxymuconolactone decarboxylase family protein [Nocardia sp. NBC_00565]|uniref:carboxymuconolactone decarboxylase family protein n=1 Tax=Nocardia sp. NBC_00565 TaxID=2975993 RepID=UPI002E7FED2D|nr:carboxymuconolactone decarboxylase family protein [Nocardia sp. NBC_00565]WUC04164.1 carboxymuconolactone decarboxylase family protein [Nocardia sp. NBC_00565]